MAHPRHALEYIPPPPPNRSERYHHHVIYRCWCGRLIGECACASNGPRGAKDVITFDECYCKPAKKEGIPKSRKKV